jgi:tRNA G18 (ribose-2'-O)-methylase SpoU
MDWQNNKYAIVLGNEEKGISNYARRNADDLIHIPMKGFAESLNLSATCAGIGMFLLLIICFIFLFFFHYKPSALI